MCTYVPQRHCDIPYCGVRRKELILISTLTLGRQLFLNKYYKPLQKAHYKEQKVKQIKIKKKTTCSYCNNVNICKNSLRSRESVIQSRNDAPSSITKVTIARIKLRSLSEKYTITCNPTLYKEIVLHDPLTSAYLKSFDLQKQSNCSPQSLAKIHIIILI